MKVNFSDESSRFVVNFTCRGEMNQRSFEDQETAMRFCDFIESHPEHQMVPFSIDCVTISVGVLDKEVKDAGGC